MIYLILKSYFVILLTVVIGSITALLVGFYVILRSSFASKDKGPSIAHEYLHDMDVDLSAIAGDDLIATQLDLARAYIETNQAPLAIKVLNEVLHRGTLVQQKEAQQLINSIT